MVFFVIFIVITICFMKPFRNKDFADYLIESIISLMISLLIFAFISFIVVCFAEIEYVKTDVKNLYAIQDNQTIQSSFFLGTGRIDDEMRYYYLVEEQDGKKMESVNVEDVILIEYTESNNNPKIEIYEPRFKSDFLRNNFVVLDKSLKKIYIPQGSIKYNYNIDLQ